MCIFCPREMGENVKTLNLKNDIQDFETNDISKHFQITPGFKSIEHETPENHRHAIELSCSVLITSFVNSCH